ncbi:MAG: hypothetical protein LBR57_01540 [Alistipes sp.]|jgi:hypothetical protein|nr:hypothetical protein [Alistipes sp.]
MKRIAILLCALALVLASATIAGAQPATRHNSPVKRSSIAGVEYHNISRTWQTIDLAGKNILIYAPTLRGVALTSGHSFLFHERPLLRFIHFGFDATWYDIEYANWLHHVDGHGKWMHKLDMAVGLGPAIHLSPTRRFGVHIYFHYNPTLSLVTHNFAGTDDGKFEVVVGYASYMATGLALSWDVFSLGGEYRHGGGRYHGIRIPDITVSPENITDLLDLRIKDALDNQRHTMRGWRVYLSFRF